MTLNPSFSDMRLDGWVGRLPVWFRPYAQLMRLDRPIGSWLLLLPCWWGVALTARGFSDAWLLVLFAFGAVVMRSAGCVINDLWDREIDRQVVRTMARPLASGVLGVRQALLLLAILLVLGLGVLLSLNRAAVFWGMASLGLVVFYPLAKRVFAAPQLVLGLAFNWGVLVASASVTGEVSAAAWGLYAAGVFWTLAYDTVYAHQDLADDRQIGVRSLALTLGEKSRAGVAWFYAICLLLLLACGAIAGLGWAFFGGVGLAAFWVWWLFVRWNEKDPLSSLLFFRHNRAFGLIVFLALLLGRFL